MSFDMIKIFFLISLASFFIACSQNPPQPNTSQGCRIDSDCGNGFKCELNSCWTKCINGLCKTGEICDPQRLVCISEKIIKRNCAQGAQSAFTDLDKDTFTICGKTSALDDCNDNDPQIYPGATEICGDNADNNCNTQTDENCQTTNIDDSISIQTTDDNDNTQNQDTASEVCSDQEICNTCNEKTTIEEYTSCIDNYCQNCEKPEFNPCQCSASQNSACGSCDGKCTGSCDTGKVCVSNGDSYRCISDGTSCSSCTEVNCGQTNSCGEICSEGSGCATEQCNNTCNGFSCGQTNACGNPCGASTDQGCPDFGGTIFTTFESFGTWTRGDQANGTFSQSSDQKHGGNSSGKLNYQFSLSTNDFVVFWQKISLSGNPTSLSAWVYGDNSNHYFNIWIEDSTATAWQIPMGTINSIGWKRYTGQINMNQGWPFQKLWGSATTITYPVKFYGVTLDDAPDSFTGSGTVYFDDLAYQ